MKGTIFATVEVFTESSKSIEWGSTSIEEYWLELQVKDTSDEPGSPSMPSDDLDSWGLSWSLPLHGDANGAFEHGQLTLENGKDLLFTQSINGV